MRAFGYWYDSFGGEVINNVRWGEEDTFSWCFDGIPKNSVIAIGTVGSGLRHVENRKLFETGFLKLLELLTPKIIIIYGSDNYSFFDNVRTQIQILQFPSERSLAYKEKNNE